MANHVELETIEKEVIQKKYLLGWSVFWPEFDPAPLEYIPMGEEISVFPKPFILALGSTQPLLCTVVPVRGYSSRGVKSTTHVPLVPKLRISGAIPTLPL